MRICERFTFNSLILVEVKNAAEPFNLIFSESFSPDWKAYIQRKSIAEEQHFMVNGFANGWEITPRDSNGKSYTVIIEYWPQRLFYIGGIISILTVVFCLIFEIFKNLRLKHKE